MKKYFIMFWLGAFSYGLIEIIWRGRSHWSMMLAGGICFIVFALIGSYFRALPLLYKCILGSLAVTATELVFGGIFNLWLELRVWDYSNIPLNFKGQICLLYSVLWGYLSAVAIPFASLVLRRLADANSDFLEESFNYELSAQSLGGN